MKTDILSFNRLGLLFRRFFGERSRYELIQWITMTIVFMFLRNNMVGMAIAILVSGVVYASNFYKEIHSPGSGAAYFMIPASQLEKTILGVVITSFYYFVMIVVAYIVGNLLGTFLNNMLAYINIFPGFNLFHYSHLQWDFLHISIEPWLDKAEHTNYLLSLFRLFLIGQSIYMLGSIYFKRNHFFATFLSIAISLFFLLVLSGIEFGLAFGNSTINIDLSSGRYIMGTIISRILRVVIWLIPLFFWVVSYFRLTEKQV